MTDITVDPAVFAASMVADSAWSFDTDPAAATGHATTRAAQAGSIAGVPGTGTFGQGMGRPPEASWWTHVACALIVLADNPYVNRGAVLNRLVEQYGDGFA